MLAPRFVAMVDVLGFSDLVSRTPVLDIVQRVQDVLVRPRLWAAYPPIKGTNPLSRACVACGAAHFSDTLLVWSPEVNDENGLYIEAIFYYSLADTIFFAFLADMPLRAGVAFGQVFIDPMNHIFVGQPIIDAHVSEASQEWVGGALHPACKPPSSCESVMMPIRKYPVPTKQDASLPLSYAIDWTQAAQLMKKTSCVSRGVSKREFGPSYRQQLRAAFERYLSRPLEARVRQKYLNSKLFAELQVPTRRSQWAVICRDMRAFANERRSARKAAELGGHPSNG